MADVCERHDVKLLTYGTLVCVSPFLALVSDQLTVLGSAVGF
jgi:hypothetical protein